MLGSCVKRVAAAALCAALAGCVSSPGYYGERSARGSEQPAPARGATLQCVPYARDHSQVKIWGDAYTWWEQAEGKYAKNPLPQEGAVMVLFNYAGPNRGHVAVVRDVVSAREIRVDHANWLDDGAIYTDNAVADISPGNDWTLVRVFNQRTGAWGSRTYPVQGFIGPGREEAPRYDPDRDVVAALRRPAKPAARTGADDLDRGTLTEADMAITAPGGAEPDAGESGPPRDAIAALLDDEDPTAR